MVSIRLACRVFVFAGTLLLIPSAHAQQFTAPVGPLLQHGGSFNPLGAHVADVDGDGWADLLFQGFDNTFYLSHWTGSGLTPPIAVLWHGGDYNPAGAHLADVDGDGLTDVLMQGFDNRFWLSLSTGTGFTPPTLVLTHGGSFNPHGAHIADVNGDGKADVLMQGFDNTFWFSSSTGTAYTPPTAVLAHGGPFNRITGAHDGYPNYEIYVGNQRIYELDHIQHNQSIYSLGPPAEWSVDRRGAVQ